MATLEKRVGKSGKVTWRVRVRRLSGPWLTKSFARKQDAETWARGIESKLDAGEAVPSAEARKRTLADVIDRRNHFVHRLFDDADLFGAMTEDGGPGRLAARVEALIGDIFSVVMKLEPGVTEGMAKIFGSPPQILASMRQLDPTTIEDDEVRSQLEALQALPEDLIGG